MDNTKNSYNRMYFSIFIVGFLTMQLTITQPCFATTRTGFVILTPVSDTVSVSPLHRAVKEGKIDRIQLLLDAGANIEALNKESNTPLQIAWSNFELKFTQPWHGDVMYFMPETAQDWIGKEAFLYLLERGADPAKLDVSADEFLIRGTRYNAPTVMEIGINLGADVNQQIPTHLWDGKFSYFPPPNTTLGRRLIHFAAKLNTVKSLITLVNHGADIQAKDTTGLIPFVIATNWGATEIIEYILEVGIPPDESNYSYNLALQYAKTKNYPNLVAYLKSKGTSPLLLNLLDSLPLWLAAKHNDSSIVDSLLKWGIDPNFEGDDHRRPLNWAAIHGNNYMCSSLIDAGADIDAYDGIVRQPDPVKLVPPKYSVRTLLGGIRQAEPVNIDAPQYLGMTPLGYCFNESSNIHYSTIQLLLARGADLNRAWDNGETLLRVEVKADNLERVRQLLKLGADPNQKDYYGLTPLAHCRGNNSDKIVKLLFESGADFKLDDSSGWHLLIQTIGNKDFDLLKVLLSKDNSKILSSKYTDVQLYFQPDSIPDSLEVYPLRIAVNSGDVKCTKLLLKHGFYLNNHGMELGKFYGSRTIFGVALENGDNSMVDLLLDFGAIVNMRDVNLYKQDRSYILKRSIKNQKVHQGSEFHLDTTAIFGATAHNAPKCVQVLIDNGLDVNKTGQQWQTPLFWAVITQGERYRPKGSTQNPPVTYPPLQDKSAVVDVLLANGTNPSFTTKFWLNLLCVTCDYQADWMVEKLLKAGAPANSYQADKSALYYAVSRRDVKIAKMLLDAGANVNGKPNSGMTPLQFAVEAGDTKMVKLLKNANNAIISVYLFY